MLRNRSCLHYCALTVSVLVIAAILRQVGCYHLYSDLEILYCSTDLVVVTVKKSRLEIQHWFGMKNGGLTSRFVPKEMPIELINCKKIFNILSNLVVPVVRWRSVALVLLQSKTFEKKNKIKQYKYFENCRVFVDIATCILIGTFRKLIVHLCARVSAHFAFSPSGLWISKKNFVGVCCVL